ncbi:MAG: hypothetical protein JO142_08630 [Burkholderiales bacterium]|nr:hypothetical protein [Burkholderiales bacterium]
MDEEKQSPAPDDNPYGVVKQHDYQKAPGMDVGRILVICLMILVGGFGLLLTMCGMLIGAEVGFSALLIPGVGMMLLGAGVIYLVVRSARPADKPTPPPRHPGDAPPPP